MLLEHYELIEKATLKVLYKQNVKKKSVFGN